MKKLMTFFALCACLFLAVSCSDDDEMEPTLDSNELAQTTWDFVRTELSENGSDYVVKGVMFFSTEKSGSYTDVEWPNDLYSFTYQIDKRLITFEGGLYGIWTVLKKSEGRIVLHAYLPKENTLVLTRKY